MKRKVVYVELRSLLTLGERVLVVPLNHTSDLVDNGHPAWTSPVQSIGKDGVFETLNTRYVPLTHQVDEKQDELAHAT
jgi:hypothetical protein